MSEEVKRRVLIMENDPIVRGLISYILERQGLEVVATSNADEALARLDESLFDAIVLESRGGDLLESIHRKDTRLVERVVVVTSDRDGTRGLPVHTVLRKPFEVSDLAKAVRAAAALS